MKTKEITIEKNYHGALVLSHITEDGYRLHRTYYGYSKQYAIKDFKTNPPQ